jgi:HPr kinase/phosphorylase
MRLFKEETDCVIVSEESFADALKLETVYSPQKGLKICSISVNRPGLVLTGNDKLFAPSRLQVVGKTEIEYLNSLSEERRKEAANNYFSKKFPCLVVARGIKIPPEIVDAAKHFKIALFRSKKITAVIINDLFTYLNELLAPCTTQHGILLDIFGIGVMLTGRPGIGKSEAALELINRGHRLVSDDVVDIKDIGGKLIGSSPEVTEHLMEIRGIGLINVKSIYGVGAVLRSINIELVIELKDWDSHTEYDRVGKLNQFEEILGIPLPKRSVPVITGRNIAVLMEAAVSNFRLKQEGYDILDDVNNRRLK